MLAPVFAGAFRQLLTRPRHDNPSYKYRRASGLGLLCLSIAAAIVRGLAYFEFEYLPYGIHRSLFRLARQERSLAPLHGLVQLLDNAMLVSAVSAGNKTEDTRFLLAHPLFNRLRDSSRFAIKTCPVGVGHSTIPNFPEVKPSGVPGPERFAGG